MTDVVCEEEQLFSVLAEEITAPFCPAELNS